jgi:hypothetical protein
MSSSKSGQVNTAFQSSPELLLRLYCLYSHLQTPHFDFVCSECARGVADVSYQYEVPTTFGVLTTSNMEQTIGRAGGYKGNKGEEATLAMIEMLYLLDQI